jgi:hypothetical protein
VLPPHLVERECQHTHIRHTPLRGFEKGAHTQREVALRGHPTSRLSDSSILLLLLPLQQVSVPVKRIKADYDGATMQSFELGGMTMTLEDRPTKTPVGAGDGGEVVYSFDEQGAKAAPPLAKQSKPKPKTKSPPPLKKTSDDPVASFWDDPELP